MARSNNQKAKILYLEKMIRATKETGAVSMQEILASLQEKGISAERKSIYDDMEVLRSFGMDIRYKRERPGGYYLAGDDEPGEDMAEAPLTEKKSSGVQPEKVPGAGYEALVQFTGERNKTRIRLVYTEGRKAEISGFFGEHGEYKEKENGSFTVTAELPENSRFYGWLVSMGKDVRILKPKKSAQAYRDYLKSLAKEYKGI